MKEITYHLRRSSEWLIRLGDGTQLANDKTQHAVNTLWKYSNEFFTENEVDIEMKKSGIGVDLKEVKSLWSQKVNEIIFMAHLKIPENDFQLT